MNAQDIAKLIAGLQDYGEVTISVRLSPPASTGGRSPASSGGAPTAPDDVPHPADMTGEAQRVFDVQEWPRGKCPVHNRDFKAGNYGPYCTAKAEPGEPANAKGYCALKPGEMYQGKRVVA